MSIERMFLEKIKSEMRNYLITFVTNEIIMFSQNLSEHEPKSSFFLEEQRKFATFLEYLLQVTVVVTTPLALD
jgi:hypothetical protein